MRAEFLAETDQCAIVVGIYTQEQLRLGHMRLDIIELVEIVEGRADDAGLACVHQRRGGLAGIGEENAGRVDALVEDGAYLLYRSAVKARAEVSEKFEEGWV